nr:MAG TPA: hypothetical protein [Bacteriophage sp.]
MFLFFYRKQYCKNGTAMLYCVCQPNLSCINELKNELGGF